VISWIIFEGAI